MRATLDLLKVQQSGHLRPPSLREEEDQATIRKRKLTTTLSHLTRSFPSMAPFSTTES